MTRNFDFITNVYTKNNNLVCDSGSLHVVEESEVPWRLGLLNALVLLKLVSLVYTGRYSRLPEVPVHLVRYYIK